MLRAQLAAALLCAITLAVAGAVFAEVELRRAEQQIARADAASATFDGLLELGAHADQLLRLLSETAITGEVDRTVQDALPAGVAATMARLRRRIAVEIELGAPFRSDHSQTRELEALSSFEADLHQGLRLLDAMAARTITSRTAWLRGMDLLDSREPQGFRQRLNASIAGERREAVEGDARAEDAMETLRQAARIYAVGSVALLLVLVYVFARRMREPFDELMAATRAMQDGDLSRRVRVRGRNEFGLIASSVNALAEQRQQQQTALAQAHDRLEETVALRTEELRVANERLTRADAQRRQLFADISHELRTPITAIRGEAEIALRGSAKPPDQYRVALEHVKSISGQMGRLVDDLLFIARHDANAQRLDLDDVPLGALLDAVCREGAALARDTGIEIVQQPAVGSLLVRGDYDRLHQLFMILIDNAVRYSDPPNRVWVAAEPGPDRVTVKVVDRGSGIAEHDLPNVFRRFYRGDRASARPGDGAGLGLPIAKAIVDAHRGVIDIDSVPGLGTTVRVSFDLAPAGAPS